MGRLLFVLLIIANAIGISMASSIAHGAEASNPAVTVARAQTSGMVAGQVMKVDHDMSSIVIKHQQLVGLGMPAMTMVFHVHDKSMLDGIREGEKIEFCAEIVPRGLLVTEMRLTGN